MARFKSGDLQQLPRVFFSVQPYKNQVICPSVLTWTVNFLRVLDLPLSHITFTPCIISSP